MKFIHESLFSSAIRSFLKTFFGIIGIGAAIIPIIIIIGILGSGDTGYVSTPTPVILPNADGERVIHDATAPIILNVDISGVVGMKELTKDKVCEQLIQSREGVYGDRVKAIMLTIHSPGGIASDGEAIYRAIKKYKEKYDVPVYAYTDSLCASGGYQIALAADKIYATDMSLIGSVGAIFSPFFNVTGLMEKVGVEAKTIYSGKGKDAMNSVRPWTPDEDAHFQNIIDAQYEDFVALVVKERPSVSKKKLVNEYGANIFIGKQAKKIGFIDESGATYDGTLTALATAAGLEPEEYQVMKLQTSNWIDTFFEKRSPLLTGTVEHTIDMSATGIAPELMGKPLYLYNPIR